MTSVWTGRSGPAPGTRGAGGPRAVWSVAASLSGSVLGAGMLLMPSVVRGVAGPFSLWAWVAHLALGTSVALLLARTVATRRPERLSDALSGLLRPSAGRLVDIVYAVAFTFGQAAIAWFAAVCVLAVFPVPLPARGAVGALLACGVLVVALSLASVGPAPGAGMSRARRWLTGLVALGCAFTALPESGAASGVLVLDVPSFSGFWLALAALFFAGVGWESVTESVPAQRRAPRRAAVGVLLGAGIVTVVHLTLAAVSQYAAVPWSDDGAPDVVRYTLAVLVLVLAVSYCSTNIRTAAAITSRALSTENSPAAVPVWPVGLVCMAWVWPAAREGGIVLLLLGPAAGAWTAYMVSAVAVARQGTTVHRVLGAGLCGVLLVVLTGTLYALSPF